MSKNLRFPRINSITISGRLTREVDLRYTPSGTPIAKLPIAFDRRYQKNGNWETETSYIDVIAWDQKATSCAEYLTKGSAILIEGRLQTRTYTNNEGRNIKVSEIIANRLHFLEWNDDKNSFVPDDSNFHNTQSEPDQHNTKLDSPEATTQDDVPF